jgi:cysteate synthase
MDVEFIMGKYRLYCPYCNSYLEEHYTLNCPRHSVLIRANYETKQFTVRDHAGIWKYLEWLPIQNPLEIDSGPVTYKSEALGRELGLDNLYICFNGYWPEQGAKVKTCTFKEYEALITLPRVKETGNKGLYLASSGNTARSFAYIALLTEIPVALFVPIEYIDNLWLPDPPNETTIPIQFALWAVLKIFRGMYLRAEQKMLRGGMECQLFYWTG